MSVCHDGLPHDWQRNPGGWQEGLICATCGVTEAEDHAYDARYEDRYTDADRAYDFRAYELDYGLGRRDD